jgi:hypothetical protein
MKPSNELVVLYQQMSDLTAPICAKDCRCPHSCCSPEYCLDVEALVLRQDIQLERTEHPTLPFMGTSGCTVPPHLRPACTLHLCSVNSLGFIPNQPELTERYFEIREKIETIEFERFTADTAV